MEYYFVGAIIAWCVCESLVRFFAKWEFGYFTFFLAPSDWFHIVIRHFVILLIVFVAVTIISAKVLVNV